MNPQLSLLVCVLSLTACDDGTPIVGQSSQIISPDSAFVATLEVVDNGLGFGQGALYEEVHVTRAGQPLGAHGDPGKSVVFYAESTYENGRDVHVRWVTARRLRVEFDSKQKPGREVRRLGDVEVEFSRRPQ